MEEVYVDLDKLMDLCIAHVNIKIDNFIKESDSIYIPDIAYGFDHATILDNNCKIYSFFVEFVYSDLLAFLKLYNFIRNDSYYTANKDLDEEDIATEIEFDDIVYDIYKDVNGCLIYTPQETNDLDNRIRIRFDTSSAYIKKYGYEKCIKPLIKTLDKLFERIEE